MAGPASSRLFETGKAAIIAAFPELAGGDFYANDAGWDSLIIDVDNSLIFKFPRDAEAETGLRQEAALLAALRPKLSIIVPDMELIEGPPLFSRHAKLPGEHLLSPDYAQLDDAARSRIAQQLANFHTEMHGLTALSIATVGDEMAEPWVPVHAMRAVAVPALPASLRDTAMAEIDAYEALAPDPHGQIFGYFDAHGWNMAFDKQSATLNGVYDFADSGVGALHQEFIYANFIDRDLCARVIAAYEQITGRAIDRRRVEILTSMLHLSDLAEFVDDAETLPKVLEFAVPWFEALRR